MVETILFTAEFNERRENWTTVSHALGAGSIFNCIDIQMLGNTDQRLLILERAARDRFFNSDGEETADENHLKVVHEGILNQERFAFANLWIFGLYEVLRRTREQLWSNAGYVLHTMPRGFPAPYDLLNDLYWDLEVLRTPLAKHSVKNFGIYKNEAHTAQTMFNLATGSAVWAVFCPKREKIVELVRKEIADEFLRIGLMIAQAKNETTDFDHEKGTD